MLLAVRSRYARPVLVALSIGAFLVQPFGSGTILPPPAFAQTAPAWSGIIDPSRAIDWSSTGVGAAIVNRTTQCGSTIAAYSGPATAVNSAIAACSNGYVLLGPGTFTLSSAIDFGGTNNVTLRGSGPTQTTVAFTANSMCGFNNSDVCPKSTSTVWVGDSRVAYGTGANTAYWTAGFAQGTTQITLSTTTGLSVGMTLFLDQRDDGATETGGVLVCQSPPCQTEKVGGQGRSGRAQLEMKQITAINGNVVTISPGLYNTNWRAAQNPGAWWIGSMLTGVGIENLTINHTNDNSSSLSGINFDKCHNCWVKNVRSVIPPSRNHIWCYLSSNITVRDSYFYGTHSSTQNAYGFEGYACADALIQNNIFDHVTAPILLDNSTGVVAGYNFTINNLYTAVNWMTGGLQGHAAGNSFNLFEENQTNQFFSDLTHGSHNQETVFRNQITGVQTGKSQETVAVLLYAFSRGYNVIGNVLGTVSYHTNYEDRYDLGTTGSANFTIYVLGFCHNPNTLSTSTCSNSYMGGATVNNDSLTPTTLFRWGNYDTVTGTVRWASSEVPTTATRYMNGNPVPTSHTLPASLYLMSKPAWWGSMPWPAIGPDVTGGTGPGGFAYAIPAAVCYNKTSKDGNGILLFDANACYQFTPTPTLSVTPTTLSFGSVAVGGSASSSLTITNTGGSILTGTASTAAPFSVVSGGSFALSGGASQTVVVQFSPTAAGTFTGSVTFSSDGGTASVGVTGTGTVVPPPALSVMPSTTVNFGSVAVGGSATSSFTVTNTGGSILTGTASTAAPFSVVSGGSFALSGGASQMVVVQFSPTVAGTFTGSVTFSSNGGTASVGVTGTGTVVLPPALSVTVNFGSVAVGGSVTSSFTVTNTGGSILTGAASTVAPFSVVSGGSFSLAGGASQTVVAKFSPTAAGTFTGSVTISSNGGTASVGVTGTGL